MHGIPDILSVLWFTVDLRVLFSQSETAPERLHSCERQELPKPVCPWWTCICIPVFHTEPSVCTLLMVDLDVSSPGFDVCNGPDITFSSLPCHLVYFFLPHMHPTLPFYHRFILFLTSRADLFSNILLSSSPFERDTPTYSAKELALRGYSSGAFMTCRERLGIGMGTQWIWRAVIWSSVRTLLIRSKSWIWDWFLICYTGTRVWIYSQPWSRLWTRWYYVWLIAYFYSSPWKWF